MEKYDSNPLSLATTSILGQAPGRFLAGQEKSCVILQ